LSEILSGSHDPIAAVMQPGGEPLRLVWSEGTLLLTMTVEDTTNVASGLFGLHRLGREYLFGRNFRVAPFGNRTGHLIGRRPHCHRCGSGPHHPGQRLLGQGTGRHRPWEASAHDTSWLDPMIRLPLIVCESGDVHIYDSIDEAARSMESRVFIKMGKKIFF
jgi:hypothetical protein